MTLLHVAFIAFAVLAGVLAALTVIANAQSAAELILLGVIIMIITVKFVPDFQKRKKSKKKENKPC